MLCWDKHAGVARISPNAAHGSSRITNFQLVFPNATPTKHATAAQPARLPVLPCTVCHSQRITKKAARAGSVKRGTPRNPPVARCLPATMRLIRQRAAPGGEPPRIKQKGAATHKSKPCLRAKTTLKEARCQRCLQGMPPNSSRPCHLSFKKRASVGSRKFKYAWPVHDLLLN